MSRTCLGWIEVDNRILTMLSKGAFIHFDPVFLSRAGWNVNWAYVTMIVSDVVRRSISSVTISLDGWLHPTISVDADGRFVSDKTVNSVSMNAAARMLRVLRVPMFSDNGQLFCPYCGRKTVYLNAIEFCTTSGHGPMPEPSSLCRHDPKVSLTWLQASPQSIFAAAIQRQTTTPSRELKQGDRCLCGKDVYVWQAGTLICPKCWHRPLEKS